MSKLYFNTKLLGLFTILGVITSSFTFYLFSNFDKDNYIELIVIVFIGSTLVSLFLSYIFSNYNKKSQESLNNKLALKTKELEKSLFLVDKYIIRTTTDTRGVITSANEAFCHISGYTQEELIGKPHSIIRDPDMPKGAFKELWDTIQSGKAGREKLKIEKKMGALIGYLLILNQFLMITISLLDIVQLDKRSQIKKMLSLKWNKLMLL